MSVPEQQTTARNFSLGIEEEYQLVRQENGSLSSSAPFVLEKGAPYFQEQIKPEMLQSTIEFISGVLPDIRAARKELYTARALLDRLTKGDGLALVSAGTHPSAAWRDERRTEKERYQELEEEYQDVGRAILIFGLHVHVGILDKEMAIRVMNQVRTWLPHILALSTNSPFWQGRYTGLKSYRTVVWKRFPRGGMPDVISSRAHFDRFVRDLVDMKCIDDGKKIWWDIRPHPYFDTLEFRICDMPATLEDTLAIAALCQALVAKLVRLNERGDGPPASPRDYIEENKWRAMRYGLDAEALDFARHRKLKMRDALHEVLDFVDEVVDDLGSRNEMDYLRALLDDPRGTGADRQIAVYKESGGDIEAVQRFLIEQTMRGVALTELDFNVPFMHFMMHSRIS
ncbi:carboxylate-amine ligase [Ktedonospora formicarum]|uniref:Putative glutamate--cysteine ligase 2 n=1 Tax=Ktedonospora formicarum TaxID=2778364 RepID=A0A8J3HXY8_9CHLR|nr:carboxylate-amine ligase [Ktedonospora formicarum]GHO45261.1 putative glutamate--cysteine ligase 2 [Ktedonospora formicarum]